MEIKQQLETNARAYAIAQMERQGYSSQLSADIYDGIEADCEKCWTEEEFFDWVSNLKIKHNQESAYLMEAYQACGRYMNQFAGAIKQF